MIKLPLGVVWAKRTGGDDGHAVNKSHDIRADNGSFFLSKSKLVSFKAILNTTDKVTRLSVCYCFVADLYHKFT
jgi:hypothetical protein